MESCVTWATSVPILVFLGLSVLVGTVVVVLNSVSKHNDFQF